MFTEIEVWSYNILGGSQNVYRNRINIPIEVWSSKDHFALHNKKFWFGRWLCSILNNHSDIDNDSDMDNDADMDAGADAGVDAGDDAGDDWWCLWMLVLFCW